VVSAFTAKIHSEALHHRNTLAKAHLQGGLLQVFLTRSMPLELPIAMQACSCKTSSVELVRRKYSSSPFLSDVAKHVWQAGGDRNYRGYGDRKQRIEIW